MSKKLTKEIKTLLHNYNGFPKPPNLDQITDEDELRDIFAEYDDFNQAPPALPDLDTLVGFAHEIVKEAGEGIVVFSDSMKGGVGKSTTAFNLATCLVYLGFKVCVVDSCPNQNCMIWNRERSEDLPNVTVVSCLDLKSLGKVVKSMALNHDFVVIDGKPGTDIMTTKGIALADVVIIPIKPQTMGLDTLPKYLDNYYAACEEKSVLLEQEVEVPAIILVNDDEPRTLLSRRSKAELLRLPLPRLYYRIDHQVAMAETYGAGIGICEGRYANTDAAKAFSNVVHEILTFIIKSLYNG